MRVFGEGIARDGRRGTIAYGLILISLALALVRLTPYGGVALSWTILGLQALLLLLIATAPRHPAMRRLRGAPILLAGAVYLWDATLPPPTLPAGLLRDLLLRGALVVVLAHLIYPRVEAVIRQLRGRLRADAADRLP